MRTSDSGNSHGTNGSPQTSFEQNATEMKAAENEAAVAEKAAKGYNLRTLRDSSPLRIPHNASVQEQQKQGYQQVKYQWDRGSYRYTSRWHQRTPNAPASQENSWVTERVRPGKGFCPGARPAIREVFIRGSNGKGHWIPRQRWDEAIRAQKQGIATNAQKEMLKNGHWPAP